MGRRGTEEGNNEEMKEDQRTRGGRKGGAPREEKGGWRGVKSAGVLLMSCGEGAGILWGRGERR